MIGKTVPIFSTPDATFTGYLAPAASGKGPGIVMLQEIYGVNQSMCEIADEFAAEGYSVLVPDLFWRLTPNVELDYIGQDLERAFELYHRFDVKQGVTDIGAAVEMLRHNPVCTGKVAVLGFCLGGKLAFLTAAQHPVDAAVCFYGGGIVDHIKDLHAISCPLQFHFGERDEMIPSDQVDTIKAAIANRPDTELYVYPAEHAFFNHHRNKYHAVSAQLAQERVLAFLKEYL